MDCLLNILKAMRLRLDTYLTFDQTPPLEQIPSSLRLKKGFDGRMVGNGSSHVASLFTQQGNKGTNQDAMVVLEDFGSRPDTIFCGVFDGHGPSGHLIARKVRDLLPSKLNSHWDLIDEVTCKDGLKETVSPCLDDGGDSSSSEDEEEECEKHTEIFRILKESFRKGFEVTDKELRSLRKIDGFSSGTTAVTLVKHGQYLVIGNIGDSRAILGRRDENNYLDAIQLTVDLKPNLPRESERIRRCKGRVFSLKNEPRVARIWMPNKDSPGLAMTRAFGDFCLKKFGLISVPELHYRCLTQRDEFIVLATDGIWDVLSNKEVVDVVGLCCTRSSAARSVVDLAIRAWKYKYPTSKMDDCAVVCLFLNTALPHDASSYKKNMAGKACNGNSNPSGMIETSAESDWLLPKERPRANK